ncbi:hypothetical protein K1719_008147 [Acacia pycnantha]|nr:hypothetical protein K1719_008147 [Acacia pycnantha]
MEIHETPERNAFLFRFEKLENYNKVLKGHPWLIQGALLNIQHWDDVMIFAFWIQFHGLPHGAFDSENGIKLSNVRGIRHEAKNCKFQHSNMTDEDDEGGWGNGLGMAHVRTMEESLIAHDKTWDEVQLLIGNSKPTAGKDPHRRMISGRDHGIKIIEIPALKYSSLGDLKSTPTSLLSQKSLVDGFGENDATGRPKDQGEKSASLSLRRNDCDNGNMELLIGNQVHNERGIIITEIPTVKYPCHEASPSTSTSTPNQQSQVRGSESIKIKESLPPKFQAPTSSKPTPQVSQPYYTTESLAKEMETQTAIILFIGLSPISAVTTGIHRINLKWNLELLEDD